MARRKKQQVPRKLIECEIVSFSHEGRGIAKLNGKTQFVEAALPGERVMAQYLSQRGKFDELKTVDVLDASEERADPPCSHSDMCGGCSLQHIESPAQIKFKEGVLSEQFQHFGQLEPEEWVKPMIGDSLGYRTKARLGVRYVPKRDEVIIGFREKRSRFITEIQQCEVLDKRIGDKLLSVRDLVVSLSVCRAVPQIEVAMGDSTQALVVRHMEPFSDKDKDALVAFAQEHQFDLYLQPSGVSSIHKVWPTESPERLYYELPLGGKDDARQSVKLAFHPSDFTQVNSGINRQMVRRAIDWLDVDPSDRVLDLFCGLGNFTIPLATKAKCVVGVEGDDSMVERGNENAQLNGLDNITFHAANLQTDFTNAVWAKEGFDKILIDPPRSGALDVVNYLTNFKAKRVVYVSCNPSTLARDAGVMVEKGYKMLKAGVMDMFPHTTHVESIALFELD